VNGRLCFELSVRLLGGGRKAGGKKKLGLPYLLSILGLVIGVASLTVSMAVVSGFEQTLQKSISDLTGHIQVFQLKIKNDPSENLRDHLENKIAEKKSLTPFLTVEGIAAARGTVQGISLQGLDSDTWSKVLSLESRVVSGKINFTNIEATDESHALSVAIGEVLAEHLGLHVGDRFRAVVPLASDLDPQEFRRKAKSLHVTSTSA
jgi:lipoprotein-releasing system permease protein